jgi:predicted MFS family arabinose efflux permease
MTKLNKIGKPQYAGFYYAGVGLGIAMTGLLVPLFDRLTDWRGAWLALGALNFLFAAISYAILLKTEISDTPKPAVNAKKPAGWINILITYSLEGFSYVIMSTFLVKIVNSIPAISHLSMGTWVIVGLAAAPSTMVWSFLAKKTGLNKALLLSYLLQIAAMILPVLTPTQ